MNSPLGLRIKNLKNNKIISDIDLSIFIESYVKRYHLNYHEFMEEPIPWILTNATIAIIADKKFRQELDTPKGVK